MLQIGLNKRNGTHHNSFGLLCRVCGLLPRADQFWPLLESPVGAFASLAFLAHFLAAPQQFFLVTWRPRVLTFSIRPQASLNLNCKGMSVPPQSEESHLLLAQLYSVQLPQFAEPLSRNPLQSPQLWSSPYALSLCLCSQFWSHE